MLSNKAKDEFRAIYEEEFSQRLTDDEVEEMGTRLLRLFSILTRHNKSDGESAPVQK